MSRTEKALGAIAELCRNIDALDFAPPGIFTNAIITKPEVTTLIRDALLPEQSLYTITGAANALPRHPKPHENPFADLRPARIDGRTSYVSHAPAGPETAVRVPQVVPEPLLEPDAGTDELLSPRRKAASAFRLVPQAVAESEDFDGVCAAVASAAEQYAGIEGAGAIRARVAELRAEYGRVLGETQALEQQVAEQRKHLEIYNDSLSDLLPRRGKAAAPRGVEEMIEREEAEIAALEAELNRRGGGA